MADHKFEYDDAVEVIRGKYKGTHAFIEGIKDDRAFLSVQEEDGRPVMKGFAFSSLKLLPPMELSLDDLKALCRFEKTPRDIFPEWPFANYNFKASYQITLEDLRAAVFAIANDERAEIDSIAEDWFMFLWDSLYFGIGIEEALNGSDEEPEGQTTEGLPNRFRAFSHAWYKLCDKYAYRYDVDLAGLLKDLDVFLSNEDRPYLEREYTRQQMDEFLVCWDNSRLQRRKDPVLNELYRRFVTALAEGSESDEADPKALEEMGYACYGKGNAGFEEDWAKSRDCFLKLMEISPKASYANTLGYIYYYGRANNGVPQYEDAFKWFSYGAAGGIYESRYKVSDMLKNGYGVPKDASTAAHVIWDLYNENEKYAVQGIFNTKFADIALRAGNVRSEGAGCTPDADAAFYHYLEAQFAIRMRMLEGDYYGDAKVAEGIRKAISEIAPRTIFQTPRKTVRYTSPYWILRRALSLGRKIEATVTATKSGNASVLFRYKKRPNEDVPPRMYLVEPEAHFCGMQDQVRMAIRDYNGPDLSDGTATFMFDEIDWSTGASVFFNEGVLVFAMEGDFSWRAPKPGKTHRFVKVSFGGPESRYDYLIDEGADVSPGDFVVVGGKYGEKRVEVVGVFEKTESELSLPLKRYKKAKLL